MISTWRLLSFFAMMIRVNVVATKVIAKNVHVPASNGYTMFLVWSSCLGCSVINTKSWEYISTVCDFRGNLESFPPEYMMTESIANSAEPLSIWKACCSEILPFYKKYKYPEQRAKSKIQHHKGFRWEVPTDLFPDRFHLYQNGPNLKPELM